jgi:hypothetical protein
MGGFLRCQAPQRCAAAAAWDAGFLWITGAMKNEERGIENEK